MAELGGSKYAFDNISPNDFDEILSQYSSVVPQKLAELEEQRLTILPTELAKRKKDGKAYFTKHELATLVDWKLSHGKFRPSLKGLVQQNSDEFVLKTTTAGLSESVNLGDALTTLTKLKGIGPATASLLLSTSGPQKIPFFSDELFRWAFWENKPGGRWDRKIAYSAKEYRELTAKVTKFVDHFDKEVSVIDVEKVAYVLGKRAQDLSFHISAPESFEKHGTKRRADPTETKAAKKQKGLLKPSRTVTKLAATDADTNTEQPTRASRSSTRRAAK